MILFNHYGHVPEKLGNEKGLLGLIFSKSQNKFLDPAQLRRPQGEKKSVGGVSGQKKLCVSSTTEHRRVSR
jgi:hypothetical protein